MRNKIITNSLCFKIILKIYGLISVYLEHSIIYRAFCSFTNLLQSYGQYSRILKYLIKESKYKKISLYKVCINRLEKFIINLVEIVNDVYTKIFINSFLFNSFCKNKRNIKKDPHIYISLTLLSGIISFSILSLFFNKPNFNQVIIGILSIITIIIFHLNSSSIIKNSNFINTFFKLLNSDIKG